MRCGLLSFYGNFMKLYMQGEYSEIFKSISMYVITFCSVTSLVVGIKTSCLWQVEADFKAHAAIRYAMKEMRVRRAGSVRISLQFCTFKDRVLCYNSLIKL